MWIKEAYEKGCRDGERRVGEELGVVVVERLKGFWREEGRGLERVCSGKREIGRNR